MTVVPLTVLRQAVVVLDADGRRLPLDQTRLVCALRAGPQRIAVDAWVDTGSPITLLPHRVWVWFERHVRWLDPVGGGVRVSVAGGTELCRRGRVSVAVVSPDLTSEFPAVTATAYFSRDGGLLRQALLGLSGGVLAGRRLVVEPDLASARLEAA